MAKSNIPSVLAFERKISPSDGLLYGTMWENKDVSVPLRLLEKSVRGTISNRLTSAVAKDPLKLNNDIKNSNPQTVDCCSLPQDCDAVKLEFTVKFLGNVGVPSACNNSEFKNNLQLAVSKYKERYEFNVLSKRYAYNLASGRYLWRNRVGADAIHVEVRTIGNTLENEKQFIFDGKNYPLSNFEYSDPKLDELAKLINQTLLGKTSLTLKVTAYAKIENGQEVYPSEELVMDKARVKKSKILYSVNGVAALHSQKIGNAIRTIDTWYTLFSDKLEGVGPIALEPYGAVTTLGKAFRHPKNKEDFYTLFDKFALGEQLDETQLHFVIGVLIRGGVFGQGEKE